MSPHDTLLETVARHFQHAHVLGNSVELGVGGLRIGCSVGGQALGPRFDLRGGDLGESPVFASVGGQDRVPLVEAVRTWSTAFGPVLRAAFGGEAHDVRRRTVQLSGVRYDAFFDTADRSQDARLIDGLLSSDTLPVLSSTRATVLSVFPTDPDGLVQVEVNGVAWNPSALHLQQTAPDAPREFAVLQPRPTSADGLPLDDVLHTLAALRTYDPRPTWRGWQRHQGLPGRPLAAEDLQAVPLEARAYWQALGVGGAGPGYGMVDPTHARQAWLRRGNFDWTDGSVPSTDPGGVWALAHGGCGNVWLLVERGPHRGEVWCHAAGSDGVARRSAPTFHAWIRDWLDHEVRGRGGFADWDGSHCSSPHALSDALQAFERRGLSTDAALERLRGATGLSITASGSPYVHDGASLDPCGCCTALFDQLGLAPDLVPPGTPLFHKVPRSRRGGQRSG